MKYVKTTDLDLDTTFFHFSRIDNRNSIEQNGLVSVAGGENKAGDDNNNPTIYFSYGADGVLKAIDVWIKWEYNRLRLQKNFRPYPPKEINEEIMQEVYEKLYNDFKNRNYYSLNLIEGDDPNTSDFSFSGIDRKKQLDYNTYLEDMELYKQGRIHWLPHYPNKVMGWMYGSYSNFENGNVMQETWNMNTHIGNKIIPSSRIQIIEGETGRTDGLSIALEIYKKYRSKLYNIDLSRLDVFISYALEKYQTDKDFSEDGTDIGRRPVNLEEEKKYQRINQISTQSLGKQVASEMFDTRLIDETEKAEKAHIQQLDKRQH